MGLTNKTIQKAKQIQQTVQSYFEESHAEILRAKELMPLFIQNGIFSSNHRDGLPIRNFLRQLDAERQLSLLPNLHFEKKEKNKNWFFISRSIDSHEPNKAPRAMKKKALDKSKLVAQVFQAIEAAKSKSDLIKRIHAIDLDYQTREKDRSYPSIPFTLKPEEIKHIASDGNVSKLIELGGAIGSSGLEKLLLVMAWKQNDLKKLGGIIRGIQSVADDPEGYQFPEKSIVFYYFGRHLAHPTRNPIIDQHVIRAYATLRTQDNERLKWLNRSNLTGTKSDQEMVRLYLKWHSELITSKNIGNHYCPIKTKITKIPSFSA